MAVGVQQSVNEISSLAGAIALGLEETMTRIEKFKGWLDTQTDAQLVAIGIVQADVNTLRSAFTDAAKLATVYRGTSTQTATYDFGTFLKILRGVSYW